MAMKSGLQCLVSQGSGHCVLDLEMRISVMSGKDNCALGSLLENLEAI
jgi:hypothetical protein